MKKALFISLVILSPVSAAAGPVGALVAQAQATYTALEPLPCIPSANQNDPNAVKCTADPTCPAGSTDFRCSFNFKDYVQFIFNLVIALSAAAAIFMIVFGGLQYMTTDSWTEKSAGLEKAKNAVYGLLLVLCSYLILRTVDPRLVAIPSTLVQPLDVVYRYNKYSGENDLLNTLGGLANQLSQADKLSLVNKQISSDVASARSNISSLQAQRTDLCKQLQQKLGAAGADANSCDDLIDIAMANGTASDITKQILSADDQINSQQVYVATEVGIGTMNDEILKCAAGMSFDECNKRIIAFRQTYNAQLGSLSNDPTISSKLNDYARYASIMAYAYSQVGTAVDQASLTPFQAALQQSFVGASTIVAGATGAVVGGTLSGGTLGVAGGLAAGKAGLDVSTELVQSLNDANKSAAAQQASANITKYALALVSSIQDPDLQAKTRAEVSAIIKGLGK